MVNRYSFAVALLAMASAGAAAGPDWRAELVQCAANGDDAARSRCYEDLGRRAREEAAAEPQATAPAEPAAASAPGTVTAAVPDAATEPAAAAAPQHPDATPATAAVPAAVAAAADQAAPPPADDWRRREPRPAEEARHLRVTGCSQDASKRWYFEMENGEVWRQSNTERLRLGECNFAVTITRDFFGYKLEFDAGDENPIRVSRRR